MSVQPKLERFNQNVLSKFRIYNSIFTTLPFNTITKTGVLLPLFQETCKKGFANGENPTDIVASFFKKYQARRSHESQLNLIFRFIQKQIITWKSEAEAGLATHFL